MLQCVKFTCSQYHFMSMIKEARHLSLIRWPLSFPLRIITGPFDASPYLCADSALLQVPAIFTSPRLETRLQSHFCQILTIPAQGGSLSCGAEPFHHNSIPILSPPLQYLSTPLLIVSTLSNNQLYISHLFYSISLYGLCITAGSRYDACPDISLHRHSTSGLGVALLRHSKAMWCPSRRYHAFPTRNFEVPYHSKEMTVVAHP